MSVTYRPMKHAFEVRVGGERKSFSCEHGVERALRRCLRYMEAVKERRKRERLMSLKEQAVPDVKVPFIKEIDGREFAICEYMSSSGRSTRAKVEVGCMEHEDALQRVYTLARTMARKKVGGRYMEAGK